MKTHNKIIVLLICVVTTMILFLFGYEYIRNQEIQLYIKSKQISDETVIKKVLKFKTEGFSKPTQDNAAWDELLKFTENQDSAWAQENFDPIIITCDMSFLGAFDTNGKIIHSVSDKYSSEFNLTSKQILGWFKNHKIIHDFIVFKGVLYEIFGAKIVHSDDIYYQTPAHGYLISAKQWNEILIKDVEEATNSQLELLYSKPTKINPSKDEIVILLPIKDHQNNILAYSKYTKSLQNLNKFKYLRLLTIAGFVILFILFIIFIYLINKWVANPLKEVTDSLSLGNTNSVENLLHTKGSFAEIAKLIKLYTEQKNALVNEINEKELAEKVIIKQKIMFEQLFKNAPIGIIMVDNNERVLDINPVFTEIFQFTMEDIKGQNLNDFLIPKNFEEEAHKLSQNTFSGDLAGIDTVRLRKDGTMAQVAVYGVPIDVDSERIGIYGMYIDITDRSKAAIQLETYSQKLMELNVTKDKFFSIIAHDLKSPFNSITGFSELLLESYSEMDLDEIKTSLQFIQSSSKQAYTLLENLLVWARSQTNDIQYNPVSFNLKEEIADTVSMAESIAAKKQIKFITDIDQNISINADVNMINTVIRNLLSNAIKFSSANGKVTISITQDPNFWLFSIRDTGMGIDPLNIDKLFKIESKFSTFGTDNEAGTGLGLILCKEFVEKHGGTIWVKSNIGQGSEFNFSIPKS